MSYAKALRCRECGREYPLDPIHVCEFCFGPLEVDYDRSAAEGDQPGEDRSGPRRSGATAISSPVTPSRQ